MKRWPLFLLLIGVFLGLTAAPAAVFATSMYAMTAGVMVKTDMASMPDCQGEILNKAPSAPCKCGIAGCVAMTAAGAAMILPDNLPFAGASILSSFFRPHASSSNMHGRSTVPEPEPPSFLI